MFSRILILGSLFLLAACDSPMRPQEFTGKEPVIAPETFFTGHTQSWGVVETTSGEPISTFTSDAHGIRDDAGALLLTQDFAFSDGRTVQRRWHFVKTDDHRFEATANDVVGTAHGEAYGNLFHWTYALALDPGNRLENVDMEQWMYLQDDGTLMNRVAIRKFGVLAAMVTEHFHRLPD
jgi:hypothetical protein